MKKIFTFFAACMVSAALFATQTTVWTGNEPISWNPEVYQGTQFETPANTFAGLAAGHTIKVTVVAMIDEPQYVLTYKAGDGWSWTDLSTTVADGVMSYTVESDQIGTEIAERNLIFRGQGYNITAIVVDDNQGENPDPQPQPSERVVETLWEGTQVLGAEGNDGFGIDAAKLQHLEPNDSIAITIIDLTDSYCQINIAANDPWTSIPGTNWESLTAAGTYRYAVADADLIANIKASGLTIQGKLCTVTKLELLPYQEPTPDPDPQPAGEYEDQTVWSGNTAISWNPEEYPGEQLDTYEVQQDMLAGLSKDDSIKIYYAEAIEGAQFVLTYKAGDSWSWTDLAITNHGTFYAYKVASDEIAQDIADHGLVIRGQGYHATSIVIGKPKSATGVENVQSDKVQSTKVLRDGQVLIIRDGKTYNAFGQLIK